MELLVKYYTQVLPLMFCWNNRNNINTPTSMCVQIGVIDT